MSRTSPVHAGYTIINGSGTGSNGGRIDVWMEYSAGEADTTNNRTWFTAYFYAALNPNYTSSTSYYTGLNAAFTVDGTAADAVTGGAYDFTSSANIHSLGSFSGWIYHDPDGTKKLELQGSFTTVSSYISGGSVTASVALPAIVRAAEVSAYDVVLGTGCNVCWTPALARHSFSLAFSLGSWTLSTDRLHPGRTSAYAYADTVLPLEIARQFAGPAGEMTVVLTTYDGNTVLGTTQTVFSVVVPENEATRPTVTAELSAVCQAFPGQYVQKLSKVSAAVTAADPLGAAITGYTISTGGSPVDGTLSEYLEKAGTILVTVTAENSRGFNGSWTGEITATAYDSPRLVFSAAYRCLSDGTADPGGTFLRIAAAWSHSPVKGENTCVLRWRYRQEGAEWSDWQVLAGADNVDTGAIRGILLEKTAAYAVELEAVDTAGGTASGVFAVPIEQVYMHRTRNAMGLGGYAEGTDLLDVHWDIRARQSINGVYLQTAVPFDSQKFSFESRFSAMNGIGNERQSVLLFGNDNGTLIQGVISINNAGAVSWDGTSGVTLKADTATGIVTVTLPFMAWDKFVLLSADPIAVV